MVTSRETLEKIREIIAKHYAKFSISMLGRSAFTPDELRELQAAGIDTSNKSSFLEMVYMHNFINNPRGRNSPTSVEDMKAQQSESGIKPHGEANDYTVNNLNDKTKQLIDKLRADVAARIEGFIRDNNDAYKFNALANLDRTDAMDELVKESSLGRVKQKLRDSSKDANRDWQRVALTEMSNAIGIGSVDRIVTDNRGADLDDIYVYRIIVGDALTCKYCRRFYGDVGQAPKLYRLSTLLANGSNYGLKQDSWKPVSGATHPNTRTSAVLELKPGFEVRPGGSVTYIGLAKWANYVHEVLVG
jgi:hypothetical protein